jgi:hypothetical protein
MKNNKLTEFQIKTNELNLLQLKYSILKTQDQSSAKFFYDYYAESILEVESTFIAPDFKKHELLFMKSLISEQTIDDHISHAKQMYKDLLTIVTNNSCIINQLADYKVKVNPTLSEVS